MKTKAVIIAGAGSSTGKTTVTLGLMAALKKRGLNVQGFKAGPDYIDPSLHRTVTEKPSINLDTWMMPSDFLLRSFESRAAVADISIIEGVMGLHDGRRPDSPEGSTAELAAVLNVPVIIVLNAKSMARTAAAIIKGLVEFDSRVNVAGIILNNIGSPNHLNILKKSISKYCSLPVFGGLPFTEDISLPSRHLGLHMGEEGVLDDKVDRMAAIISEHINIDNILSDTNINIENRSLFNTPSQPVRGRIAVASDRAFCFHYEDNLAILRQLGYEIDFFSPMKDRSLPSGITAVYFAGGYPELYADVLANNIDMRNAIKEESEKGTHIYGECGGLMYLGRSLTDARGKKHTMCGCMPYETIMESGLQSLGYSEVFPKEDFLFMQKGKQLRGHCFHYSKVIADENIHMESFYHGTPAAKATGYRLRNTVSSYVHIHMGSIFS